MSVHYKFRSALEYDTITFDGLHISVKELKNAILQQKRIGRHSDFDLQVTDAQTKKVYSDDQSLIPKNTSLLIARVPAVVQPKPKSWEYGLMEINYPHNIPHAKAVDLSTMNAPEEDKIMAMMTQSTQDYDPSNYLKIRGANQVGLVPGNYRCYKCHQPGHWIKDCPLSQGNDQVDIKKSTGIPRSFMVEVEGPQVQGAMMTPYGSYAVPALDHQTYTQKNTPAPPPVQKTTIPDDLMCSICSDLLTDAVMIPCCGNSFCDECIRSCLLESEDHECPDCHERDISPGTLIPNRFLRNSVANFKSTTGYVKRHIYKPGLAATQNQGNRQSARDSPERKKSPEKSKPEEEKPVEVEKPKEEVTPTPVSEATTSDETVASTEKPIISEADSTETSKSTSNLIIKESLPKPLPIDPILSELPPGVSPTRDRSPEMHPTVITRQGQKSKQDQSSPRQQGNYSNETEDRSGTPTVDEPGNPITVASGDNYRPYSTIHFNRHHRHSHHNNHHSYNNNNNNNSNNNNNNNQMMYAPQPHGMMQGPQNFRMHHPRPTYMMGNGGNGGGMYNNMQHRPHMYDHQRPPHMQINNSIPPQPCYGYQNRPPRIRPDYIPPPINNPQTPPGIIDDPLEAFNRMLREKDERERRARANKKGRSYSRSSSRSYSRSPPSRRRSTRSPRRRTRSRSKSFSISRSRSRSYSSNHHDNAYREYSPRRRPPSKYRSNQHKSPTRYHRDRPRNYNSRDRDMGRGRDNRDYGQSPRDGIYQGRGQGEYNNQGYDGYDREKNMNRKWGGQRDGYYAPPQNQQNQGIMQNCQQPQQQLQQQQPSVSNYQPPPPQGPLVQQNSSNRYGRDYPPQQNLPSTAANNYRPGILLDPPVITQSSPAGSQRRFDILSPGTDQPLPPGEEPVQGFEHPSNYTDNEQRPPEYDRERDQQTDDKYRNEQRPASPMRPPSIDTDKERGSQVSLTRSNRGDSDKDNRDKESLSSRQSSRSPQKRKSRRDDSPTKSQNKDKKKEKDRDRDKDHSDDDKTRKSKDKKKKRDKRESDKKKKKERKEKRESKKDEKDVKKDDKPIVTEETKNLDEKIEKEIDANKPEEIQEPVKSSETKPEIVESHVDELNNTETENNISTETGDVKADEINTRDIQEQIALTKSCSLSPVYINPSKADSPDKNQHKEEDVLELETSELKTEMEKEASTAGQQLFKWEMEDEPTTSNTTENDPKVDKSKVTQDVLKRAENAIFAKAINAIRPIEIKKISVDRAKLYSGEKDMDENNQGEAHEEDKEDADKLLEQTKDKKDKPESEEVSKTPVRLSVKERLGHKVDDLDRIVQIDHKKKNKSKSLSPFAKRALENKERRVIEVPSRRSENRERNLNPRFKNYKDRRGDSRIKDQRLGKPRIYDRKRNDKINFQNRDRFRNRLDIRNEMRNRPIVQSSVTQLHPNRFEDKSYEKRKRTRSRSISLNQSRERKDDKRRKEKKQRKERDKDNKELENAKERNTIGKDTQCKDNRDNNARKVKKLDIATNIDERDVSSSRNPEAPEKPNNLVIDINSIIPVANKVSDKRKVTLDEENFIPDYDAESDHLEIDELKKRRIEKHSSSSSDSSADEVKKRKKNKKHSKKKKRRDSSSSSSSDSSSSDDEKEKSKRKKHKKKSKKKKKNKHKS